MVHIQRVAVHCLLITGTDCVVEQTVTLNCFLVVFIYNSNFHWNFTKTCLKFNSIIFLVFFYAFIGLCSNISFNFLLFFRWLCMITVLFSLLHAAFLGMCANQFNVEYYIIAKRFRVRKSPMYPTFRFFHHNQNIISGCFLRAKWTVSRSVALFSCSAKETDFVLQTYEWIFFLIDNSTNNHTFETDIK